MILQKAQMDNSRFKAAVRGSSGSGKTWWATAVAIGLHKAIGSKKPIAFWDTENAASYVLPHFKHNGIEVVELKARAFKLTNSFFDEAEATCDIAIIDSMTHIRDEMIEAFKERKHKEKLAVWDYGIITPEFNKTFLDRIVNSPLHIIGCGRLSDIYEYIEVDGQKVLTTTGSKMRAGKDTEYEFSLTVELERFTMSDDELKELARSQKGGSVNYKLIRKAARFRMTIIKDRANVLASVYEFEPYPGEFIGPDNDIWLAVKPFCDALSIGGAHVGVNLGVKSTGIFESPDTSYQERERQKTILLEEVEGEIVRRFGQSKDDKAAKIDLVKAAFGTSSWTAIQGMTLDKVREGHDKIVLVQNGTPPASDPIRDMPRLVEKIKADLGMEVDTREAINQLKTLYAKPLVLRDDLSAAINLSGYDVGADKANIRDSIKSNNANLWKQGIGRLIAWLEKGE